MNTAANTNGSKVEAAVAAYVLLLDPAHRTDEIADARYHAWVRIAETLSEDEAIEVNEICADVEFPS